MGGAFEEDFGRAKSSRTSTVRPSGGAGVGFGVAGGERRRRTGGCPLTRGGTEAVGGVSSFAL